MEDLAISSIPSNKEFEKQHKISKSEGRKGEKPEKKDKLGPFANHYKDKDEEKEDCEEKDRDKKNMKRERE